MFKKIFFRLCAVIILSYNNLYSQNSQNFEIDLAKIGAQSIISPYGGIIKQSVWFEPGSPSLSGMSLKLLFSNSATSSNTAYTFYYNGNFEVPQITTSSLQVNGNTYLGNSTSPRGLRIFAPASTGAKGVYDAGLTIWQSTDKIMHLDGNDIWSEDVLYLNDFSDKNVSICPKGSGNVGIGTVDTKGYKLAVNGSVICTKLVAKPTSTWPDFVFAKTHKRATLAEVEQYIHTHGHLQDMPTAQQVAEQGVDVGEMNRLLLQKVEELTLQLIELNKTVEQLKRDVKK
jgi:hypothetical protein